MRLEVAARALEVDALLEALHHAGETRQAERHVEEVGVATRTTLTPVPKRTVRVNVSNGPAGAEGPHKSTRGGCSLPVPKRMRLGSRGVRVPAARKWVPWGPP